MEIKIVTNPEEWNVFVTENSHETFHQSWEWGEIYQQKNQPVWQLGVYRGEELVAAALTIKVSAKRGAFLLIPHGPIIKKGLVDNIQIVKEIIKTLQEDLKIRGEGQGASFIRIAPILPRDDVYAGIFKNLGFRKAPMFTQSEQSLILNISHDIEELLRNMRKTTRQIIKKPLPEGFSLSSSTSEEDFDHFYNTYKETVSTKNFAGLDRDFLWREFTSFHATGSVRLYFAHLNGRVIGTAFIITQGQSGFYHYGGHIDTPEHIPTGYLIQWYVVQDLKNQGYTYYNLWGVSPKEKPRHPWYGLSLFKRGFGGEEYEYLQTQDYVLRPTYWFNWVVETARRIKRNY